jgi:hypothetical protein
MVWPTDASAEFDPDVSLIRRLERNMRVPVVPAFAEEPPVLTRDSWFSLTKAEYFVSAETLTGSGAD